MRFLSKIAIFFTGSLSAFTVICGLYIAHAPTVAPSSLNFHMGLGILTILSSFATIALLARSAKTNTS